jgi:hypothetical protein
LQYESGKDGKLIGVADRNDHQVLWFEHDADGRPPLYTTQITDELNTAIPLGI